MTPQIYHTTVLVLFSLTSYATASVFNKIHKEIESSPIRVSCVNFDCLIKWKHFHLLTCDTVDAINNCFGWSLCLSTPFLFIAIINEAFYIFGERVEMNLYEISFLLTYAIQISLICIPPYELHRQVIKCNLCL